MRHSCCALVLTTACPMSPWNIAALVALQGDLKTKVLMSTGLSDKLQKAAGGFMSASEEQQVKEQHGDSKKMAKLIQILKGKQDKDFKTFLKMLRSTNNAVWADELERRAKELKRGGSKSVRLACEIGNKTPPSSDTPKNLCYFMAVSA